MHSLSVNCRYTARVEVEDHRRRRLHHQARGSDLKPEATNPGSEEDDDDESPFAEDDYIYDVVERSQSSTSSSSSPSNQLSFATPSCGKSKSTHNSDDQFCINTGELLHCNWTQMEAKLLRPDGHEQPANGNLRFSQLSRFTRQSRRHLLVIRQRAAGQFSVNCQFCKNNYNSLARGTKTFVICKIILFHSPEAA